MHVSIRMQRQKPGYNLSGLARYRELVKQANSVGIDETLGKSAGELEAEIAAKQSQA